MGSLLDELDAVIEVPLIIEDETKVEEYPGPHLVVFTVGDSALQMVLTDTHTPVKKQKTKTTRRYHYTQL